MSNNLEITIYFAGYDIEDAKNNLPFDSVESCEDFAWDNGMKVFCASAIVDLSTMEEA